MDNNNYQNNESKDKSYFKIFKENTFVFLFIILLSKYIFFLFKNGRYKGR